MPYGEIVTDSFRLLWRQKRLLLFSLLGFLIIMIGLAIYQYSTLGIMNGYLSMMGAIVSDPYGDPSAAIENLGATGLGMLAGFGALGLLSLIGYVVNLFMRAATLQEAREAWSGRPVIHRFTAPVVTAVMRGFCA